MLHCLNRCVRRALLCGTGPLTGINYDYRRDWIRDTQETLAGLFAIEIGFRSEMSNHLHVVLRTRPDIVECWSDEEVVRRWLMVAQMAKSLDGTLHEPDPIRIAQELAKPDRCDTLRERLSNPSWFMGTLCESISRRANHEEATSGRFWTDRFKSRQLLDESSILVCGIYVDLNPIRAGEAWTPEEALHTSAYDRIQARQLDMSGDNSQPATDKEVSPAPSPDGWMCELTLDERTDIRDPGLTRSATQRRASDKGLLPISLDDYLELLDASGRIVKSDKKGAIPENLAPILERLNIRESVWGDLITGFDSMFGHVVGSAQLVAERAAAAGRRWYRGVRNCQAAFG